MPERHPSRIAVAVLLLPACGGAAPAPVERPPEPAPFVMQRPPEPQATKPAPAPLPTASAAPAPRSASPGSGSSEPAARCSLSGRAIFPANTPIEDASRRVIARFSGAEATVKVSEITLASAARARIETGSGRGGLRVQGYVEARKVPAFTQQSVSVFGSYVSIGERRAVSIAGATADGKIKIEKIASSPIQQTFSAWTTCPALTLTPGPPPGWSPAGNARGYVFQKSGLELFDSPEGRTVGALQKAPGAPGLLFFSTEQTGGWVRVELHGQVNVNAWARASDLSALPRGETMDQVAGPTTARSPARLVVPGAPKVIRIMKDVLVRGAAKDTEIPIGLLEPDAEVYVMDTMAGWMNVMPRALDVVPPEGGSFWVKKSDL
jgi:hypothetical protein